MTVGGEGAVRQRLGQVLREAPAEAEAIEFEGAWWSWGRLRAVAAAVDDALRAAGVGTGARVGLVLENRPEHVAALLDVLVTDRCLVTLSPLQPPERLSADLTRSTVPVLLASPDVLAGAGVLDAAAAHGLVLELNAGGEVRTVAGAVPAEPADSPGVAVEMLTSGTTGPPKRIRLSDRQLDSVMASSGQPLRQDRLLAKGVGVVNTPLVHIGGLWGVLAGLHAGRRVVLMPRFTVDSWVDVVARHRPQAAGLVPAAMRMVLDADVPPEKLAGLKVVTSGAAPCPPELAEEFFRKYGVRVLMVYGATEFAGAVAGWTLPMHQEWWERKAGSVGRPYPGVDLRVTTPDGEVLAPGGVGHLEVRSSQSPQGSEHWQRTSDLAEIDEDGFLFIRGRADDAIIRGGFKVHPDVVARVLERHPSVREAAVAPLPHPRLGQIPVAAVELEPGAPRPDPEELIRLCREELTPYEVPSAVLVVDELPRSPSMKVSRPDLVALFDAPPPAPGAV
jgi:long-chain acyl-CoA synthetase